MFVELRTETFGQMSVGVIELILIGNGGKDRRQKRSFGGFENAGIAVVRYAVEEGPRPSPRLSSVPGSHHLQSAKRANMVVATAREDQEELTICASRDGRPALIILGLDADGFDVDHFDLRCGETDLKSVDSNGKNRTKLCVKLRHGKNLRTWVEETDSRFEFPVGGNEGRKPALL